MGNLLVWMAINKAMNEANNRQNRKSHKKSNEHSSDIKPQVKGRSGYSFEKHICYIIENNPELHGFFEKLGSLGTEIDILDTEECHDNVHSLAEEYLNEKNKVDEMLSGLETDGISMTENIRSKEHFAGVKVKEGYGFGGNGEFSYKSEASFCIGFNGIKLTTEMLEAKDVNPYEKDFLEWERENVNIEEKILELEERINIAKKKLKMAVFNRNDKKEEINAMEHQLEELKREYECGIKKRETMEIFGKMSESQKAKILNYLKQVSKCEEIGEKMLAEINKSILIRSGDYEEDRNKWDRAIDKGIEIGSISEEDVKKITELLSGVEFQKGKDAYETGINHNLSGDYAQAVDWFVGLLTKAKGINDLERKDNELLRLEQEEKTISQTEKLIKIMINENQRNQGQDIGE